MKKEIASDELWEYGRKVAAQKPVKFSKWAMRKSLTASGLDQHENNSSTRPVIKV